MSHVGSMLWKFLQRGHQGLLLLPSSKLVPDIVGLGEGELELVADGQLLDQLVHRGGAALGHPVVDQDQALTSSVRCGGSDVIADVLMENSLRIDKTRPSVMEVSP